MLVTQVPNTNPPMKTTRPASETVEEVECADCGNANEEEERSLDAQVRKGLVQALVDPVPCAGCWMCVCIP